MLWIGNHEQTHSLIMAQCLFWGRRSHQDGHILVMNLPCKRRCRAQSMKVDFSPHFNLGPEHKEDEETDTESNENLLLKTLTLIKLYFSDYCQVGKIYKIFSPKMLAFSTFIFLLLYSAAWLLQFERILQAQTPEFSMKSWRNQKWKLPRTTFVSPKSVAGPMWNNACCKELCAFKAKPSCSRLFSR